MAVEADVTVTFHAAKVGQWIDPGKGHTGELRVAEIGIPAGAPIEPSAGVLIRNGAPLAPSRGPASTKFTSGQVVIVGGSRGLTGAVCMSARPRSAPAPATRPSPSPPTSSRSSR